MCKKISILFLFFSPLILRGQETWTLERCIQYAQQNSRTVKQSRVAVRDAELVKKQSVNDRHPSVSAGTNLGINLGRSINPSTNQFETQSAIFNSLNLNLNATIFAGGRIENTIKQSQFSLEAAQADLEQSANNIALSVAQAYLQILLNEEQLENARKRLQTSQNQLLRVERQILAGQLAPNARFDLQAQIARDEQQIVTASNNVDLSYLNIKNLLELTPELAFKIEKPNIVIPTDANPDGFMFRAVYNQALSLQPQIRAAEMRIKAAETAVKVAQAALVPTVSAFGGLSTNYASTFLDFNNPNLTAVKRSFGPAQPIQITRGSVTEEVQFRSQVVEGVTFPKIPYLNQIDNNFGQNVGVSVQVPIYDGLSRKITVQRQKLNVENQVLALEQNKQQLKTDVQNAIASARAAKKQYEAAQKTLDALRAAFDATDKRFQAGNANSFELTQARNNLDTAERDVIVAKYDYLFRLKIVEFYEGKKLGLR